MIPRTRLPRHLPRVPPEQAPKRAAPPPVQRTDDAPDSDSGPHGASDEPEESGPPDFDVMVGAGGRTPQYGLLGSADGRRVALNLNGCDTISLFGVQGFGKSYTLGVVAEMAAMAVPKINHLPSPLGVVLFHYHRSDNYEPEQATATAPNDNPSEVERLIREYGASPAGLRDVVILRIFERTMYHGEPFSKLIVFDEAHKYITDSKLIGEVVEAIRQIRHEQNTIVIASQDPLSVPRAVIELSTILVLHRMTSPAWVKHLRDTTEALKKGLDVAMLARLNPGEALVWCQRSSDMKFTMRPQLVRIRPRFTQHGGGTKTAVR